MWEYQLGERVVAAEGGRVAMARTRWEERVSGQSTD